MNAFRPHPASFQANPSRQRFLDAFRAQIRELEQGRCALRLPQTRRLFERHPRMAYHFKPELFLQTGGSTEFFTPDERFVLEPGEICVMPRAVPHGEVARDGVRPFQNIVVCFYNDTVAIHVARAEADGTPTVDDIFFFSSTLYGELVSYLHRIGELRHAQSEWDGLVHRGLLLATLVLLHGLVAEHQGALFSESERVFRCQWLIRNNVADPSLSVESLAAELHCTPDHLSKVFHHETGERIVESITRTRVNHAVELMRCTELSVKEIAAACGFGDANYFARVFRKSTGVSPLQYRQERQRPALRLEPEAKAVFFDREEHNFGLRPEVMARAETRRAE